VRLTEQNVEVSYILKCLKTLHVVHCGAADMRTELMSHREQSAATSAEPRRSVPGYSRLLSCSVPGYSRLLSRSYWSCRFIEGRELVRFLWSVHRARLTAYVMGQELDTDSIE
jgi:hypothetical protein